MNDIRHNRLTASCYIMFITYIFELSSSNQESQKGIFGTKIRLIITNTFITTKAIIWRNPNIINGIIFIIVMNFN